MKRTINFIIVICIILSVILSPSMVNAIIANPSNTDKLMEFNDLNMHLNSYIQYLEGISSDQLSAGLLKYNSKLDPALVVMYTETKESNYGDDNYLHLKVLTQVDGRLHESYSETYHNYGALAESEYEWNILSDVKSGIDFIEIKSSEVGQGNFFDYTKLYEFTGKNLVDILSKSGEHIDADSNPNSKMEYNYAINGKETSKVKYDIEIKNKKVKYMLVERSMGPTLDYYNTAAPIYNELVPSLYLNHNTRIKANPVIINGRTLVPLRALLEEMGATVEWDGITKAVKTRRGNTNIIMKISSDNATVNGNTVKLDVPAQLIDGVTYIPARFVGESFNYKVLWIQKTKTILINSY